MKKSHFLLFQETHPNNKTKATSCLQQLRKHAQQFLITFFQLIHLFGWLREGKWIIIIFYAIGSQPIVRFCLFNLPINNCENQLNYHHYHPFNCESPLLLNLSTKLSNTNSLKCKAAEPITLFDLILVYNNVIWYENMVSNVGRTRMNAYK